MWALQQEKERVEAAELVSPQVKLA